MRPQLSLYRRVVRAAHGWPNVAERTQMLDEARSLFRLNGNLERDEDVQAKMFEAESRLELALHYGIAAPRLYNVPPGTLVQPTSGRRDGRTGRRAASTPAYMDSLFDESGRPLPDPKR